MSEDVYESTDQELEFFALTRARLVLKNDGGITFHFFPPWRLPQWLS